MIGGHGARAAVVGPVLGWQQIGEVEAGQLGVTFKRDQVVIVVEQPAIRTAAAPFCEPAGGARAQERLDAQHRAKMRRQPQLPLHAPVQHRLVFCLDVAAIEQDQPLEQCGQMLDVARRVVIDPQRRRPAGTAAAQDRHSCRRWP